MDDNIVLTKLRQTELDLAQGRLEQVRAAQLSLWELTEAIESLVSQGLTHYGATELDFTEYH